LEVNGASLAPFAGAAPPLGCPSDPRFETLLDTLALIESKVFLK